MKCDRIKICSKYNDDLPNLLVAILFSHTLQTPMCQTSSAPIWRYCMLEWNCTICCIKDLTNWIVPGLEGHIELGNLSTSRKQRHSSRFKTNYKKRNNSVSLYGLFYSFTSMWPKVWTKGITASPASPASCNISLASRTVYPFVRVFGPLLPMEDNSRLYGKVSSHSINRPVAPQVRNNGNNYAKPLFDRFFHRFLWKKKSTYFF